MPVHSHLQIAVSSIDLFSYLKEVTVNFQRVEESNQWGMWHCVESPNVQKNNGNFTFAVIALFQSSTTSISAETVECARINPHCLVEIEQSCVRCSSSIDLTCFSRSLLTVGRIWKWVYSQTGVLRCHPWGTGTTLATFHFEGNSPVLSEQLNNFTSGSETELAIDFNIRGGILSIPDDLFAFNDFGSISTSSSLQSSSL